MLFMNKTLLRLARGLWLWILAIAGVSFLTLVGTTALAEIIAGFLGSLFEPQEALSSAAVPSMGLLWWRCSRSAHRWGRDCWNTRQQPKREPVCAV